MCDELKMEDIGIHVDTDSGKSTRWRVWILFLLIAFLFHLVLFGIRWDWSPPAIPPKVEVQQIDPKKLDAIRQQWKEKSLLLNKDPSQPKEKDAPPDARYFSDRNRNVEKEERARESEILPKPGQSQGSDIANKPSKRSKAAKPKHPLKTLPNLGNLALPFHMDGRPQNSSRADENDALYQARGANQTLKDDDLPVGSENILKTQESIFYSFYARIYETVGPIWQSRTKEAASTRPVSPGEYVTVVEVILDQGGNLKGLKRLQSSGIEVFDEAVDQTWKKVARFPNPPQGLLDRERQIHMAWTFTLKVGQGFNFNYMPPERNY